MHQWDKLGRPVWTLKKAEFTCVEFLNLTGATGGLILCPRRSNGRQVGGGRSEGGGSGQRCSGERLPVSVEGEARQAQGRTRQRGMGLLGTRRLEAPSDQWPQASAFAEGGPSRRRVRIPFFSLLKGGSCILLLKFVSISGCGQGLALRSA